MKRHALDPDEEGTRIFEVVFAPIALGVKKLVKLQPRPFQYRWS